MRIRIEEVLNWATAAKIRTGDNPARWDGNLQYLLPSPRKLHKVKNFASLPYAELPALMEQLREQSDIYARAAGMFHVLSLKSQTAPIVVSERLSSPYSLQCARMKVEKDHRVPLTDEMLEILGKLPRKNSTDYIFARPTGKKLQNDDMRKVLRGMGYDLDKASVHGFRATFKTWANATTAYANELIELVLAHAVGSRPNRPTSVVT